MRLFWSETSRLCGIVAYVVLELPKIIPRSTSRPGSLVPTSATASVPRRPVMHMQTRGRAPTIAAGGVPALALAAGQGETTADVVPRDAAAVTS